MEYSVIFHIRQVRFFSDGCSLLIVHRTTVWRREYVLESAVRSVFGRYIRFEIRLDSHGTFGKIILNSVCTVYSVRLDSVRRTLRFARERYESKQ